MPTLTLLMAQINPTVGAIASNTQKIIDSIQTHQDSHDLIVFPELAITGYPPEDLLLREELYLQVANALQIIKTQIKQCHVIIGHPSLENGTRYNSASVFSKGERIALYHKQHLPNYGVFDERRYFSPGNAEPCWFMLKNHRIGLCICEDIWQIGPVEQLISAGVEHIISLNASPFDENKTAARDQLLKQHALKGVTMVYVNLVGGQDELVFDGQSRAMDAKGTITASAPAFTEHLQTLELKNNQWVGDITPVLSKEPLIYDALVCGLRDYVNKNHFPGVLLGLSGGIDSALTLCVAVDALGASRVQVVLMPSRYTAEMSIEDAIQQAETMGVAHTTLSIEPTFQTLLSTLSPSFKGQPADITEENLQARVRGILLMGLANKSGNMLLTTSNKSELAVGYSTLYGDMCGGFAPLKDVLKTQVYALSHYRNSLSPVIPQRVLTRAPSAELAPNQTDQDSLPDYIVLDGIIKAYMEKALSANDIIQLGYKAEDVFKILRMIKRNEFKRRQAAPGTKITSCAFGRDWRYPLTSNKD